MILEGGEALEMLHRYRALQPKHIAHLLFLGRLNSKGVRDEKSAQQAANRDCLVWLKDRRWVEVIDGGIRKGPRLHKLEMLILTRAGHQELNRYRQSQGLDPHGDYEDPIPRIYERHFEHWLSIVNMAVAAELSIRLEGGVVNEFWDDAEIRRRSKARKDSISWGGLEPDGLIIATIDGQKRALLLESDLATESIESDAPNSLRTKFKKYREFYINYRQYDPLLMDLRQPTVHIATTSEERLSNILACIDRLGGRQSYWSTLHDWLKWEYQFLGEVWNVSGRDGIHSPLSLWKP